MYGDGVDFEVFFVYHCLVVELFLIVSMVLQVVDRVIILDYRQWLAVMVWFTLVYLRLDGFVFLWGDNDDVCSFLLGG